MKTGVKDMVRLGLGLIKIREDGVRFRVRVRLQEVIVSQCNVL